MFVPIQEFAPDADQTVQGVLVDVEDMIPTLRGYKGAPSVALTGLPALSAECVGATVVRILDGSNVLFAGTQTKLYKAQSVAWEEVTRVSDVYTGSATSRWRFAQQGNITLAVNRVDVCQQYNHASATDFSDLAAMPKTSLVEAVGQFVLIANYNLSGTETVDGWGCSAIGDYTDWTASLNTQCTYGRLVDTPGELTGLRRLGDYAIFYKRKSIYLARYVGSSGSSNPWDFSLVSDIIGAVSQEAIVKIGRMHYFLGEEDFYSFDSASINPISGNMRKWFNRDCNNLYRAKTTALHDIERGLVYWFYAAGTSSTPNAWVSYNFRSNRWGKGTLSVQTAVEYVKGGTSYASMVADYPTYDTIPSTSYELLTASAGSVLPAIIDTSNIVKTLTGSSTSSSLTTNDFGMDDRITLIKRVRPRYLDSPDTAEMIHSYRDNVGDSLVTGATVTADSGKLDLLWSARWHRGKLSFTGDVELTGLDVTAIPVSAE